MLVLAPTRELALQTFEVCESGGRPLGLRSVCCYGGVPKNPQRQALRDGVHILVATPGRLLDLIKEGVCYLTRVSYLVLDEADRMLDMGFEKDVRTVMSYIRPDRQTLMFSATWPRPIQRLANDFLVSPVQVTIGLADLNAARTIEQRIEIVSDHMKDHRLDQLLREYHRDGRNRILIFVNTKRDASRISDGLNRQGWRAAAISGDVSQVRLR